MLDQLVTPNFVGAFQAATPWLVGILILIFVISVFSRPVYV